MAEWLQFFTHYGYWFLFGVGFLEYLGAPISGAPVVIASGTLAALGILHPGMAVLAVSLGGLLADSIWYGVARWRGQRIVDLVCGFSSNPRACVFNVLQKVARAGPWYILPAKFIPGTGTLIAATAGFAGIRFRTFLWYDALGLLLWTGVYTMIGWLFASQIQAAGARVMHLAGWLIIGVVLLIIASVVWRIVKVKQHRTMHAASSIANKLEPLWTG